MNNASKKSFLIMLATVAFIATGQISCGGESESSKIDFNPEKNPIAVNADLTIGTGDDEVIINKPWYRFRYTIRNGSSDKTLYLVTIRFFVTGYKGGIKRTSEAAIDPGANCADDLSRPYLGIIDPGVTFSGYLPDTSGKAISHCDETLLTDPSASPPQYEDWLMGDLPDSDNLVYSIRLEGEGWFEKNGEITERAIITGFQITR